VPARLNNRSSELRSRDYTGKIALLSAALFAPSASAFAEGLQFQCGASSGHSYYADQGLAAGQGGWSVDGISDGEFVFRIDLDQANATVRFKDATGEWSDASDLGGTTAIWHVQTEPVTFGIGVVYSGPTATTMEVYALSEIDLERRTARMISTTTRISEMFTNARLLTADCVVASF
jgi:hypothetical protein